MRRYKKGEQVHRMDEHLFIFNELAGLQLKTKTRYSYVTVSNALLQVRLGNPIGPGKCQCLFAGVFAFHESLTPYRRNTYWLSAY